MNNVRCYFRHNEKLGRIDVSSVEDYETAILHVKEMLVSGIPWSQAFQMPTVLAVAK